MSVVDPDVLDVCEWRSLGDAVADVCLGIARRRLAGYALLMLSDAVSDRCAFTVEGSADASQ